MHDLLAFLEKNPGPWAVGFATYSRESDDFTAGGFHALCNNYTLNSNEDCICFYQGEEGEKTAEVVIPLNPLTQISNEGGTIVLLNANLHVAVEGFEPEVMVYVQALS